MSSRFTKLFKPSRSSRRDMSMLKDNDTYSLAVTSVSSNSIENGSSDLEQISQAQQQNQQLQQHSHAIQPPAAVSSGSNPNSNSASVLTRTNSEVTAVSGQNSASMAHANPVVMGSSLLITNSTNVFNDSTSTLLNSSMDSDEVVLKLSDSQVKLLKWSWTESIISNKEKGDHLNSFDQKIKTKSLSETFASVQFWSEVYSVVYVLEPELCKILPTPEHQTTFFIAILRMAILNCADLTVMNEYLKSIGRRHGILFGAEPGYFQTLGIAIIRTLNDRFGDDFTPELENVWILLYCYISNTMIESCSIDPILPENDTLGIMTRHEESARNTISKKKSMMNAQAAVISHRMPFAPL